MAPRSLVCWLIFACALAGCFEVRTLDRRFDAGQDAAPGADSGAEAGPGCADIDKSCDGVDDDCDGRYDEDFAEAAACGVGQCRALSTPARCVSGFPIDCLPGAAADEACNGVDDDCDGEVDEDLVENCGGSRGICRRGASRCIGGVWSACDGIEPTDETCDGRDEDCDGETDEGLTRACDGAGQCGDGFELCRQGEWQGCDGMGEAEEQCNGVDDDCDGVVDEAQPPRPCGSDLGVCAGAMQACEGGGWAACSVEPAPTDTCDGLDEDCDGRVDEGEGPCGACTLDSRPICPLGVDPCPDAPSISLCIRELHRVDGLADLSIGRRLVDGGDLDGDGLDDIVAGGQRGAWAISSADGERLWSRDSPANELGALAAADLNGDGQRETILVDVGMGRGEVIVFGPGGNRRGSVEGQLARPMHGGLAAVDGAAVFGVGMPEGLEGRGQIRLLRYEDDQIAPNWTDVNLEDEDASGFGAVLAAGRLADGRPVVAATAGAADARRVWAIPDGLADEGRPAVEVIPPGRGVGGRLIIGQLVLDQPSALAATNDVQPWVDLAEFVGVGQAPNGVRLPLDDVARDIALVPARDGRPPLLALLVGDGVRLLAIGPDGSAGIVELALPDGAATAIAGAAHGPEGSRLLAIGRAGGRGDAGQVVIYRID